MSESAPDGVVETPVGDGGEGAPVVDAAPPVDGAPVGEGAPVAGDQGEDTGGGDARDAEIAELRRQLAEVAPIVQAHREAEDANKSDLQRAQERAAQLEAELTAAREASARATVAARTGLPTDVVALLQGATEEDLMAAAEKVKAAVAATGSAPRTLRGRPVPRVGGSGSTGGGDVDADSPEKLAAEIRKRMLGH